MPGSHRCAASFSKTTSALTMPSPSEFHFVSLVSSLPLTPIARGDSKTIASLTTGEYAKSALKKLRSLHPAGSAAAYRWRLVSQPSPVCIVSTRAIDGYFGLQPPRTGNTLYMNVLARFETIQSLTRRGVASTTEPKRVVEHLVFEKRMWYDTPWVIKEQLHVDR
jgi:protein MBA1